MYRILSALIVSIIFILPFVNFDSYYNDTEIRLGMSGPFSGSLHTIADELMLGINAYFNNINEQGGVYGRTFKVITKDDKYEPKITAENAEELIKKDKVFAFLGFIGTPTSRVALPIAIKYKTPYIGAFTGAEFLRELPRNPFVLNGRTSYRKEIEALVNYFVDKEKYTNIAVFYQNDSYGRSGLKGVKEALSKRNMSLVAEASYKRNTLSVGHALYEISQSNAQVVIMVGATKPTAEFIKRARQNPKLKNIHYGAISFIGSSMLLNALDKHVENIVFSQVVPSPWGGLSSEVNLYRKLMDKYYPNREYSYVSLEGFFIAKMTTELFKRVGPHFTKEDYIDQMRFLYREIKNNQDVDESRRVCKCLNNVYLTTYSDGIFWDVDEEDN
ncbi:ABC transporter substrate-binding protein [Sulfurospirillum arcachonense]|uniref:ABC transporter substrate-binding protein n=1 Tax=Sulfurospirillum arcachonense TaxID=57666 RepID=UPI0004680346|nr:ABC transporter substrate-binding protein [Sulfurospirillum arcachonense]